LLQQIRDGLSGQIPAQLVDELLASYGEAKKNFYLGGLRLSEVEGGRFSEAAFRILQEKTTGKYTPLSRKIDSDRIIVDLANLPSSGSHPDSLRLHILRALRIVYDIRNNRDAAHLADGIDPNLQDATLVVSVLDWVLAELVRLYHSVSANEAQRKSSELSHSTCASSSGFQWFSEGFKSTFICWRSLFASSLSEGVFRSDF
jgi:hypothetical protein